MTSIFDRFPQATTGFAPQTVQDLFALRLAQKLHDEKAVAHYASLASEYSEFRLLTAYRRALRRATNGDLGRLFQDELERAGDYGPEWRPNLLALRVERRSVASAVFYGSHIEYTQVRQLASSREKALASATGFVRWLVNRFPIESVALEEVPPSSGGAEGEIQRWLLSEEIIHTARDMALPIWKISKAALFEGCGHPPLRSRKELREMIAAIWPVLAGTNGKTFIRDAVALGIYVQTERMFTLN